VKIRVLQPSLHTTLEETSDEADATPSTEGNSRSPSPRGRNVVTPTHPITTTPMLDDTPALQTILTVTVRTTTP
jgi:hypothetical protein